MEGIQAAQKNQAVDEMRMAEIAALLEKFKESDLSFDDLLVRKVVETVRVESTENWKSRSRMGTAGWCPC